MHQNWARRVAAGATSITLVLGVLTITASPAFAAGCSAGALKPVVYDSTVNQGLGSATPLTRNKDTLVRVYLSLPSCATSADYLEVTGGSVTVSGVTTPVTATATPAPGPTYARVAPYTQTPQKNLPADLTFIVPGSAIDNATNNGQFSASFQIRVDVSTHPNGAATGTPAFVTTTKSGTIGAKSNNLRVLLVAMGDGTDLSGTQWPAAAEQATQNGMHTVSRLFPVRNGFGSLTTPGNGLRFTRMPTMLDISAQMQPDPTDANKKKFCGTNANFTTIKSGLANLLVAWNAANPGSGADRVMGVVWEGVSKGAASNCYEGLANINGQEGWARVVAEPTSGSGTAGGLIAHELTHTLGGSVAPGQVGGHSPTQNPDVSAPDRGFNIENRQFIADDRNVMRYQSSGWNNANLLYEKEDWAYLLCKLTPGATGCSNPGAVGVGAAFSAPAFVIVGRAPATGGPDDVRSYRSDTSERSRPDSTSPIHVLQFKADGTPVAGALADVRYAAATTIPNENEGGSPVTLSGDVLDLIVDLDLNTEIVQVTRDGVAAPLYTATKTGQPVISSVTHQTQANITNTGSASETTPAISDDGLTGAWELDGDIQIRAIAGGSATTIADGTEPDLYTDGVSGHPSLVFNRGGDVVARDLTTNTERVIYRASDQIGFQDAAASHPSASPDGASDAVSIQGNIYVLTPGLLQPSDPLKCQLNPVLPGIGCTQIVGDGDDTWPSWSSLNFIAYQRGSGATASVHKVDPAGSSHADVETGASMPSTSGATVAYVKGGTGIVLEDTSLPAPNNTSTGSAIASDAAPSLASDGTTFVFDRTLNGQHDIFLSVVSSETIVSVCDDNPNDARLDAYVNDGESGNMPVFVGRRPTSVIGCVAQFDGSISQSGIKAGSNVSYVGADNFSTSTPSNGGRTGSATAPQGAILVPAEGFNLLQYDAFPASGSITGPNGLGFADEDYRWNVSCSGFTRTGTGRTLPDIQPPPGGFPPGPCTVTLSAHTAQGNVVVDSHNGTMHADANHNGVRAGEDVNCSGATADNDPNSRFSDYDGDGIPNGLDSQPCVSANTVTVDFDPNTLNIGSSGTPVTMYISAPAGSDLRTVSSSTIGITQIAGYPVSMPRVYWSAGSASSATAQFARQPLNQFFTSHPDLIGQKVKVFIGGTAPTFTMRGADPNAPLVSN